jgi:probable phosphoglycerate mutase
MRLLLLRHGQTPSNITGAIDTAIPGADLTDLGVEQANAVPEALRDEQIDALFVSPLLRTHQTAAPLARIRGLEPRVIDGLREIEAGDLEMNTDETSIKTYVTTALAWLKGDLDARAPGAESGREFFARFDAAIAEVFASGVQTALVVNHGAAIRAWVAIRCDNTGGDLEKMRVLENTGLVIVEGSPGAWRLAEWRGEPIGGAQLEDATAIDPTGQGVPS